MIDSTSETLILLSDVPKRIPAKRSGKRVHISAVYRWAGKGCRGVILETLQAGGVKVTSAEALQRFFVRLSRGESEPAETPRRTFRQRQRSVEAAEREFAAAGV